MEGPQYNQRLSKNGRTNKKAQNELKWKDIHRTMD